MKKQITSAGTCTLAKFWIIANKSLQPTAKLLHSRPMTVLGQIYKRPFLAGVSHRENRLILAVPYSHESPGLKSCRHWCSRLSKVEHRSVEIVHMFRYLLLVAFLAGASHAIASTPSPSSPPVVASNSNQPASGPISTGKKSAPEYPPTAMYTGTEGNVRVCFTIANDGSVRHVVVESVPHPRPSSRMLATQVIKGFKKSAIDFVSNWRFKPQLKNGKPVATPGVCTTLRYRLHSG